jgi:importin subunit alpha-1
MSKVASEESKTLQQKRDEFIVDIRREERMNLINSKKFYSLQDKVEADLSGNENPLSYLEGRPESAQLLPHVSKLLEAEPDPSKIADYVELMKRGDLLQKHTGIIMLRKCLSIQENTPIQEVIDMNAVPYLINLINDDSNPHLQIEATWCVTNMATGTTIQTNSLVEKGIIPIYIKLLVKSNIHLVEQAVWGIGNIAGDCITFRDLLVANNAMAAFVALYNKVKMHNAKVKEQIIWAASNLCRLKPPPQINKVYQGIGMFAEVLKETNKTNVITDCCWGLSQACRAETAKLYYEAGIIKRVIELLHNSQLVIIHPCLRIVGIFTNGEDDLCQVGFELP